MMQLVNQDTVFIVHVYVILLLKIYTLFSFPFAFFRSPLN